MLKLQMIRLDLLVFVDVLCSLFAAIVILFVGYF